MAETTEHLAAPVDHELQLASGEPQTVPLPGPEAAAATPEVRSELVIVKRRKSLGAALLQEGHPVPGAVAEERPGRDSSWSPAGHPEPPPLRCKDCWVPFEPGERYVYLVTPRSPRGFPLHARCFDEDEVRGRAGFAWGHRVLRTCPPDSQPAGAERKPVGTRGGSRTRAPTVHQARIRRNAVRAGCNQGIGPELHRAVR